MTITNKRNKSKTIIPVILAGGSGTRLWPISRKNYPKSLLKLNSNMTLLQNVLSQIKLLPNVSTPLVMGNIEYGSVIVEHLKEINVKAKILLETESRNTAAATAIAAQYTLLQADNPLLLILPIDHAISNFSYFSKMIQTAAKTALNEKLITFGVNPNAPLTSYGYIKKGSKLARSTGYLVEQFVEKPNSKKAVAFLKSGNYFWNSGIFLFLASTFLEELATHSPTLFSASKKIVDTISKDSESIRLNTHLMKGCPSISIDEAILEKTNRAVVFPFKGNWYDLGNWDSLYKIAKKDKKGNAATKHVVSFDTKDSYLYSTKQLLVTSGINNLLVVVTKDAVLVACRDKVQDMKQIVNYLISKKRTEAILAPVIYKSWGYYEVVDKTKLHHVKHFFINPKEEFAAKTKPHSLTYWFVVEGKGRVFVGKTRKTLSQNKSITISSEIQFIVKNSNNTQLHFIEICKPNNSRK